MTLALILMTVGIFLVLGLLLERAERRAMARRRIVDLAEVKDSGIEDGGGRREDRKLSHESRSAGHELKIMLGWREAAGGSAQYSGEIYWQPDRLANPHFLMLGGTGSGKTQTIKAMVYELAARGMPSLVIDLHGDMEIGGENRFEISMESEYGINPLEVDLDRAGGGPDPQRFIVLRAIADAFSPMGTHQLSLLDEAVKMAYARRGVLQRDPSTWALPMPNFADVDEELTLMAVSQMSKRTRKTPPEQLRTKIAPVFDYRIFSRPQVPLDLDGVTRIDLGRLPAELQRVAGEAIVSQTFRRYQMAGETGGRLRRYLVVDEAKLMMPRRLEAPGAILNRVATEGRKFGLGLIVASQSADHISKDIKRNTFAKLLLKHDLIEVAITARRFQVDAELLKSLTEPGLGLLNFGDQEEYERVRIWSYDQRVVW